jgi:hypothetical protein
MAFTASSSELSATVSLTTFQPVMEKLNRTNHQSWKAQVLLALRGAQLADWLEADTAPPAMFLPKKKPDDDSEPPVSNPAYATWIAKDQMVLSYLHTNLSKEILGHVNTEVTARGAWAAIEALFMSQSRAKIISTRMALATVSKGTSTITEYFSKMKRLADEMAAAGRCLEDEEMVSYELTRLDLDYDSVVSSVAARVEPISVAELYTQLVIHEQRLELRNGGNQSSANSVTKRHRNNGNSPHGGRGGGGRNGGSRGGRGGFGRGGGGRSSFQPGVYCQIYGKEGHPTPRCFKRYDNNFNSPP